MTGYKSPQVKFLADAATPEVRCQGLGRWMLQGFSAIGSSGWKGGSERMKGKDAKGYL